MGEAQCSLGVGVVDAGGVTWNEVAAVQAEEGRLVEVKIVVRDTTRNTGGLQSLREKLKFERILLRF
jgi:hypothetical protein